MVGGGGGGGLEREKANRDKERGRGGGGIEKRGREKIIFAGKYSSPSECSYTQERVNVVIVESPDVIIPNACKESKRSSKVQRSTESVVVSTKTQTHWKNVFVDDPSGEGRLTTRWLEATPNNGKERRDIFNKKLLHEVMI